MGVSGRRFQMMRAFTSAGGERVGGRNEACGTRARRQSTTAGAPGGGSVTREGFLLTEVLSWDRAGRSPVRNSLCWGRLRLQPLQSNEQRKLTVKCNVSKKRTGGFIDRDVNNVTNCFFGQVGVLEYVVDNGSDASLSETDEEGVKHVWWTVSPFWTIKASVLTPVVKPLTVHIPASHSRVEKAGEKTTTVRRNSRAVFLSTWSIISFQ